MRTYYSHQTKDSLMLEYTYRIEALLNKIAFLEAQLEIEKQNNEHR